MIGWKSAIYLGQKTQVTCLGQVTPCEDKGGLNSMGFDVGSVEKQRGIVSGDFARI